MSNFMLEPYVKTQTLVSALVERQRQVLKGERGASALEYVGLILVAAFIVGAIVTATKGVPGKIGPAITKILSAG